MHRVLQAGGLSINPSDVALNVIADRVAKKLQTQSSIHTIVVDFPENFPIVSGDETRLEQVLSNLISNGIKYSPQGGEIRISGQVRPYTGDRLCQ